MQAILTKYHPVTNTKPSRISAAYAGGRIIVNYDHALNLDENHKAAANVLSHRLGWNQGQFGKMVTGTLPSGDYCHVFTE